MDEETKRREEIEARLEERTLRQEQERRWQEERMQEWQRMEQALLAERQVAQQQMQTMFSYLQGLGASINYQLPPTVPWPPPPLPQIGFPSIFPPHGATGTHVSMNLFTWLRIHIQILRYFMSIYHVLYLKEHLDSLRRHQD